MQILSTILYIVLFLVFLSILICIHELGHLAAAKAFKVYCLEYSIGMGPAIFKHKGKGKETQFSIRAIPFGGYVSMYGEGVELPEGVEIDPSRSLNNIKPWKRAIVLLAGVTMNAVLALLFFFVSNCFPQESLDYLNHINVAESSLASAAGLNDGGYIKFTDYQYHDDVGNADRLYYMADNATIFDGDDTVKYATCFNFESLNSYKHLDLADYICFYELTSEVVEGETVIKPDFSKYVAPTFSTAEIHLTKRVDGPDGKLIDGDVITLNITQNEGKVDSFGCSIYYIRIQYTFPQIVKHTFTDFGRCSVLLFKAIGQLFTDASAWSNIGGIVAVGFETTAVLQNYGFGVFLFYWGFISVNLAIFNLLPFPGLDGWQLLVLIVETTTRKKIPEKVKNIVSLVGIGLLLLLMGVVVVKDIIKYVFMGICLL